MKRKNESLFALAVFLGGIALYLWTLAPTILWGDSGRFQELAYLGQVPRGLRAHPLWVVLANAFRYLPLGDAAFRANLASAVFAAGALAFLYRVVVLLTGERTAALLAAGALAVSHTFWLHAVMAEVYSLNALFLILCLYLLLRWSEGASGNRALYGSAFFLGLSLANHLLMLTFVPGWACLVLWKGKKGTLPAHAYLKLVFFAILGALPFLYWGLVSSWQEGTFFTRPEGGGISAQGFMLAVGYLGYQFLFSLAFAAVGLIQLCRARKDLAAALGLAYLGAFLFALNFRVPDQYAFYLPSYVVVAVICGVGLAKILPCLRRARAILLGLILGLTLFPVVFYRLAPGIARRTTAVPVPFRLLATREPYGFFLYPSKRGYQGARLFAEDTLKRLPPQALIMADWTLLTPLDYLQRVEGRRPDVEVVETLGLGESQLDLLLRESQKRPVFIADTNQYYEMPAIREHFQVIPFGYIYRLEPEGDR